MRAGLLALGRARRSSWGLTGCAHGLPGCMGERSWWLEVATQCLGPGRAEF